MKPSDPMHVLVVEDDNEDYLITSKLLAGATGLCAETERAARLDAAVARLGEGGVDVVLLDLSLPDSGGWETFVRLHEQAGDVPIILVTGLADEELGTRAIHEGAQDYLVKDTLEADALVRSIRYAVERARAEVTLKRYRDHLEELVEERTAELKNANVQLQHEAAERQQAEREKEALQNALLDARKLEAVGRLAGGIAHEFNNALTVITGYAEMLNTHAERDAGLQEDVDEIIKASEQASALTRQLLAFGRQQTIRTKVLDANVLIHGAAVVIKPFLGAGIELETCSSNESVHVEADAAQIETVLMNLALNARDAMPDGGVLTIRVESVIVDELPDGIEPHGECYACISFQDTGEGMDGETLKRAFDPFFTTKRGEPGAGLGLSVVYGIVKDHGGWVDARSTEGEGTLFRLYLPAVSRDLRRENHGLAKPAPTGKGRGQMVLLVEDEDSIRGFLERVFEGNGYRIRVAGTAAEAIAAFDEIRDECCLVFSDVILPDGHGLDMARTLRGQKADLKVLLTSGYSDGRSHRDKITASGYGFVPKPYSIPDLMRQVDELLASPAEEAAQV